jgi:hypothetical protein
VIRQKKRKNPVLQVFRVPTSVGLFLAPKSPTNVGTLNTVSSTSVLTLIDNEKGPLETDSSGSP